MSWYYKNNKEKWTKRRQQKKDEINAAKRKKYAEDKSTREYYKLQAKSYRAKNPHRRRQWEISKRYGLDVEQYNALIAEQSNQCAICLETFSKTPHVDHCHDSMKVRGLLCFNCNRALGHFQDSSSIMQRAINYIEKGK